MEFDEGLKRQVREEVAQLLREFSLVVSELKQLASHQFVWDPPWDDVQLLFNHHIDAVWASPSSSTSPEILSYLSD